MAPSSLFDFRYPVTRVYPFAWFRWVVFVGGFCVIILFSVLNFAANGYILTVRYTNDYNGTIATKTWSQKLAFNGGVVASCQPQNLQVHSQFYTDKLALVYSLDNIWVEGDEKGRVKTLPSLQYANNPLRDCSVPLIQIDLDKDDRNAAQIGWTTWGASAVGMVTCFVDNEKTTRVNLTVRYEFVTPTIESGAASRFVQSPDEKEQSVLWWGESLLSWYWLNLVASMKNQARKNDTTTTYKALKGSIAFEPSKNVTDITSLNFFTLPTYHFTYANFADEGVSQGRFNGEPICCIHLGNNPKSPGGLHHAKIWPDVWIEADTFAKVMYSVILADLGQQTGPTNLLGNASSLALFSRNITQMAGIAANVETPWLKAGPARAPYQANSNDKANLTITPSVFFTEYLCQMPTLKSAGSLILAVLVADLVFLNAAWLLLNWFAVARLESKYPLAYHCAGCVGGVGDHCVETKDGGGKVMQTSGYELVGRDEGSIGSSANT